MKLIRRALEFKIQIQQSLYYLLFWMQQFSSAPSLEYFSLQKSKNGFHTEKQAAKL